VIKKRGNRWWVVVVYAGTARARPAAAQRLDDRQFAPRSILLLSGVSRILAAVAAAVLGRGRVELSATSGDVTGQSLRSIHELLMRVVSPLVDAHGKVAFRVAHRDSPVSVFWRGGSGK
jgi:hypothetical protein